MRFVSLSTLLMLTCGTVAQAADTGSVASFDWTGPYVGAEVGYGWGDAVSPYGNPASAVTFPNLQNPAQQNGVFGGVVFGDNLAFSKEV